MQRAKGKKGGPFMWTDEEEQLMLELLRQNVPMLKIGKQLGCGYKPIKRFADLHDIVFGRPVYGKRMTPEVEIAILKALRNGMTLGNTAILVNYPQRAVEKIARKHKVKVVRKHRGYRFNATIEQEIVLLIQQRVSLNAIAKRYNCGEETVSYIAKRYGVKPNAKKDGERRHMSKECAAIMAEAYKEGATLDDMASQYHTSVPVIRRTLVRQGVPIRLCVTAEAIEDSIAADYTHGGLTVTSIQEKYKVTGKVVRRVIDQRGLKRIVPAVQRARQPRRPFYDIWLDRYGKEGADRRREEHRALCSKNSSGSHNAMYGKPSPQGAGNGWKGWYKDRFFRSLRELAFMLELEERGVQWINGEKGEYRVTYVCPTGTERTYAPDFIVPNEAMYEIKPKRLWNSPLVLAKQQAAEKLCEKLGLEYRLVDPVLDETKLLEAHKTGNIRWIGKTEERFLAYYGLTTPSSSPPPS